MSGPIVQPSYELYDRMGDDDFEDATVMLMPAVYALMHHGVIVYIGQSKKPLTRIYAHRIKWGKRKTPWLRAESQAKGMLFDEIWVKPCRVEDLDQIEGDMILKYKPRHNLRAGKYTTIPLEAQDLVARIVARNMMKAKEEPIPAHMEQVRISRRGF